MNVVPVREKNVQHGKRNVMKSLKKTCYFNHLSFFLFHKENMEGEAFWALCIFVRVEFGARGKTFVGRKRPFHMKTGRAFAMYQGGIGCTMPGREHFSWPLRTGPISYFQSAGTKGLTFLPFQRKHFGECAGCCQWPHIEAQDLHRATAATGEVSDVIVIRIGSAAG